jgi:hypothetical protein
VLPGELANCEHQSPARRHRQAPGLRSRPRDGFGGGTLPRWSDDGRSLYFAQDNQLVVASATETGGSLHFGTPRAIMPVIIGRGYSYDVTKDGRILALVTSDTPRCVR